MNSSVFSAILLHYQAEFVSQQMVSIHLFFGPQLSATQLCIGTPRVHQKIFSTKRATALTNTEEDNQDTW